VALTPRDIQNKRFHDTFRGYNQDQVDLFLDEVAEALASIHEESRAGRDRIEELEGQLQEARETETMLKRTLVHAEQTAHEAVSDARARAQELVAASERQAQDIVIAGERRAQDLMVETESQLRDLESRLGELKRFERSYRSRIQAFLETQLRSVSAPSLERPARPAGPAQAPVRK
jgi:cell division initiation protein